MNHKTILKSAGLLFLFFGLTFCKSSGDVACIDESKISDGVCTQEYVPVCGCDGKTYGNACTAERNGLTSWKDGECE